MATMSKDVIVSELMELPIENLRKTIDSLTSEMNINPLSKEIPWAISCYTLAIAKKEECQRKYEEDSRAFLSSWDPTEMTRNLDAYHAANPHTDEAMLWKEYRANAAKIETTGVMNISPPPSSNVRSHY
jgi:hypothetical protein